MSTLYLYWFAKYLCGCSVERARKDQLPMTCMKHGKQRVECEHRSFRAGPDR